MLPNFDRVSPIWLVARASQLEGTFPNGLNDGGWPVTVSRVLRGWGAVSVGSYPWDPAEVDSGPPPDPSMLDQEAKRLRMDFYSRVWDAGDCVRAFSRDAPTSATFFVTEQWRHPPDGRLDSLQPPSDVIGGHSVHISPPFIHSPCPLTWNEDDFLVFMNSWGETWGNRGWGAMTHEFFNNEMYEAWAIESRVKPPKLYGTGIQHVQWGPVDAGDRHFYGYDVVNVDTDDRMGWALVVHRRGELHVDDLYVKPEFRKQGIGSSILKSLLSLSDKLHQPLRLWVPFADVDQAEKLQLLPRWFDSYGMRLELSPRRWAAYCAVVGRSTSEVPTITLPPKAKHTFVTADALNRASRASDLKTNIFEADSSIETIHRLGVSDLSHRCNELQNLKCGWYDGQGIAPSREGIRWLENNFSRMNVSGLPLPYLYPTPEGGIRAEWSIQSFEISLDIDFNDRSGAWHLLNLQTQKDESKIFLLGNKCAWERLSAEIRGLMGGQG